MKWKGNLDLEARTISKGLSKFNQRSSDPSAVAGEVQVYAKNDDKLYLRRADGTILEIPGAGAQGFQGLQGDVGVQGDAGSNGVQGDVGSNGAQGNTGSQGDAGSNGVQGDVGSDGSDGSQGAQGWQGDDGEVGTPTLYSKQTATDSQTVFTIPSPYSVGTNSLWVFRNGQRQTVGVSYTETDNTTITFDIGLVVGDEVLFIQIGSGPSNLFRNEFTSTASQTVFNFTFNYTPGDDELIVFSGGALMRVTDDYAETDGDTITFVSGRPLNELVDVFKVGNGGSVGLKDVEASTDGVGSPNVLTVGESGKTFSNEGTAAKNYHDLPSASAGLEYTFVCQDAFGIRATAASGDTIRLAGTVSSAAGNAESTVVGSVVRLLAINSTEWVATSIVGTWVVT